MKKLLLFVALSTFVFTSCSKDEEESSIVGKWYLYSKTKEGKTKVKEYECKNKDYTEFTSDGKVTVYIYNFEKDCKKEVDKKGTYVFKGNKLTITGEDKKEYTTKVTIKADVFEVVGDKGELIIWKRLK